MTTSIRRPSARRGRRRCASTCAPTSAARRAWITGRRAAHPLFTFTAEFPDAASGGKATLKLRRLARCRGKRYVFKTVGTYRGVFDAKGRAKVRIRRQRKVAYYLGVLRFAGTRFYRASTDPNGVLLQVPFKGGIEFVDPRDYPQCPGGV